MADAWKIYMPASGKTRLTQLLTWHVVRGTYTATQLTAAARKHAGASTLKTVRGEPLTVTLQDGKVWGIDTKGGKASVASNLCGPGELPRPCVMLDSLPCGSAAGRRQKDEQHIAGQRPQGQAHGLEFPVPAVRRRPDEGPYQQERPDHEHGLVGC